MMAVEASRQLTERERAILFHAAHGDGNKQIAAELRVSEGTVKTHLDRVYRSLQVDNRTSAVLAALRRGDLVLAELRDRG